MGLVRECETELQLRGNWVRGYREQFLRVCANAGIHPTRIVEDQSAPPDDMVRLAAQYDIGLAVEPGRDLNNDLTVSDKMFTYMLAGNAIIATTTTGQKEIMEQVGDSGFSYKPGDIQPLARQLQLWHENWSLLENARHAAWKWGTEKYNWNLEKTRFLELVTQVLDSKRKTQDGKEAVCG